MTARTDLELIPVRWAALSNLLSLLGLGLLIWGASAEVVHLNTGVGRPTHAFVLLAVAAVSWVVAMVLRRDDTRVSGAAIALMALAGGALAAFAPTAMVFPAMAVFGAAVRWRIQVCAIVAAAGWLALFAAELGVGISVGVALGCLAAILGGALLGIARRQAVERTQQAAQTEMETVRTEVERERAELLSERNHLAREIHDVLAHTLAALSLQLEAFGTVIDAEPATSPAIREQLDRTRRLVREGLEEARGAVRALRDDAAPLDDQLRRLSAQHHAEFATSGRSGLLSAPITVGIYRVTQEALTNVMKHTTGARTSVHLLCEPHTVTVTIENESAHGSPALQGSGGGHGLLGIAERLALLGGTVEAGPTPGGWRVTAVAPVPERSDARQSSDAP